MHHYVLPVFLPMLIIGLLVGGTSSAYAMKHRSEASVFTKESLSSVNFVRGTWIWPADFRAVYDFVRSKYPSLSITEAVELAAEVFAAELLSNNITDAFIQVKSTAGYAFYPSAVLPPYPSAPYNLTNIYLPLIDKLHKHGIRVHAWIVCFQDTDIGGKQDPVYHVGRADSNWTPYPVTTYVRPANTSYVEKLADFTKELLKMGFDGIHLDYIRYGHMVYSFAPKDIERAENQGINVSKVIDAIRRTFYSNYSGGYDPTYIWKLYLGNDTDIVGWFNLRRNDIHHAIKTIAEAARKQGTLSGNPPILSAALMPDVTIDTVIDGFTIPGYVYQMLHYAQIYEDFASEGYWLIPMAYYKDYNKSKSWVGDVTAYTLNISTQYGTKAVIGIQAYNVNLTDVQDQISFVISKGGDGYVLFRWGTYRSMLLPRNANYTSDFTKLQSMILKTLRLMSLGNLTATELYHRLVVDYVVLDSALNNVTSPDPAFIISSITSDITNSISQLVGLLQSRLENAESLRDLLILLSRVGSETTVDRKLELLDAILAALNSRDQLLLANRLDAVREELISDITELKNTVAMLEKDISDLSGQIRVFTDKINDITIQITQLNLELNSVIARTTQLENNITRISTQLSALSSQISAIATGLTQFNMSITQLSFQIDGLMSRITQLEFNVSNINEGINMIGEQLAGIRTNLTLLETTLERYKVSVSDMLRQIDQINAQVDVIREQLNAVSNKTGSLEKNLSNIVTQADALTTRVNQLEINVNSIASQVNQSSSTVSSIIQEMNSAESKITTLESAINNNADRLTALNNKLSDLDDRVTALSKDVESLRPELSGSTYTSIAVATPLAILVSTVIGYILFGRKR